MSIDAAYLGVPRIIDFDGQQLKIGLITGTVKAEFERAMEARVAKRLDDQYRRGVLNRQEYQNELRILGARVDGGEFALLNQTHALTTTWCQLLLLKLLMPALENDTMTRLFDERQDEIQYHIANILDESFPKTKQAAKEIESRNSSPFVPLTSTKTEQESRPTP
jgi:hypothetical protein